MKGHQMIKLFLKTDDTTALQTRLNDNEYGLKFNIIDDNLFEIESSYPQCLKNILVDNGFTDNMANYIMTR